MTNGIDPAYGYGPPTSLAPTFGPPASYGGPAYAPTSYPSTGWGHATPIPPRPNSHTGLIIGLVVGVVVLALAGVAIFVGPALLLDHSTSRMQSSLDDMTGKNTQEILAQYLDVEIGTVKVDDNEYMTSVELPVTMRNKGDHPATFSVEVEALDESGNRLTSGSVYATNLAASQSTIKDVYLSAEGGYTKYDLSHAHFNVISATRT